ncbi:hypothetical protein J8J27_22540, partial [Mycobacterium tuberculosis]|nr:hypothetical protein [Mycobacterium tuberculosis]
GIASVPEAMVGHLVGNGARVMIERGLAHHRVAAGAAQIDRLIQAFLAHYADNVAVASRPYPGVLAALDRFAAADPAPKGELDYLNPFTLLVAVVLSAQATDAGVNKATKTLFELAPTPAAMLDLGEDRVRDLIKTIGLYRNKA